MQFCKENKLRNFRPEFFGGRGGCNSEVVHRGKRMWGVKRLSISPCNYTIFFIKNKYCKIYI